MHLRHACACGMRVHKCARGDKAADVILRVGSPAERGTKRRGGNFLQTIYMRDVRVRLLFAFNSDHLAVLPMFALFSIFFFPLIYILIFFRTQNILQIRHYKLVCKIYRKFLPDLFRNYEILGNRILARLLKSRLDLIQLDLHPGSYILERLLQLLVIKSSVKWEIVGRQNEPR